MNLLKLKIISSADRELACGLAGETASLIYAGAYQKGDRITLETGKAGRFCMVQLEDSMPWALVYVSGVSMVFYIPEEGKRPNYSPKSFTGTCHLLRARAATAEEIAQRRNLALNVYDEHENKTFYPHATANVETRGEAVFAARNAIDGVFENASHGNYPYESWGINRDPNAALTLDFGRKVVLDEIRLTLRADYPHDNYWTQATVTFEDGTSEVLSLTNAAVPQCFAISPRTVQTVTLEKLIMAEGESPFPALTQIEAWGTES
ncbi:MAG: carbohydrate-binding protein [Ruthenibacterium sp.]